MSIDENNHCPKTKAITVPRRGPRRCPNPPNCVCLVINKNFLNYCKVFDASLQNTLQQVWLSCHGESSSLLECSSVLLFHHYGNQHLQVSWGWVGFFLNILINLSIYWIYFHSYFTKLVIATHIFSSFFLTADTSTNNGALWAWYAQHSKESCLI